MSEKTKADEIRELGIEAGRENLRERETAAPPPAFKSSHDDGTFGEYIDELMPLLHPDMHVKNPYGRLDCLERLLSVAMNGGETSWHRSMRHYISERERFAKP
jgi:hypothetical protein